MLDREIRRSNRHAILGAVAFLAIVIAAPFVAFMLAPPY